MSRIPLKYQVRIDYWNSKGLRASMPGSKSFEAILENLKDCIDGTGTYVKKPISIDKFRLSVDRWTEAVFNPKLRPVDKKKIKNWSLAEFIYRKWADPPYNYSLIHYSENRPEPIRKLHKTALYDHLCQSYVEKNGSGDVDRLTYEQMENIVFASRRLTQFIADHKGKIDNTYLNTHKQLTDVFVRHVIDVLKNNLTKFNTRALTYNNVWEMLPNFFQQHGYFVATKRRTMAQLEEEMNAKRTRKRPTLKRRRTGLG